MFSGIISALGVVKNITFNDIYSVDIEVKKINVLIYLKVSKVEVLILLLIP